LCTWNLPEFLGTHLGKCFFLRLFSITFSLFAISIDKITEKQRDQTALIIAACGDHKDVVRVLLERGANVEASDKVRDVISYVCARLT
jgi:hypothetical protein